MKKTPKEGDIFTIAVSKNDIDTGVRFSSLYCPIANSLKRKNIISTIYSGHFNIFRGKYLNTNYILPPKLREFIRRFDAGSPVKPITVRFKLKK